MRQRRWLELVKNYDCEILYHLGKVNVVADTLSMKVSHSAALITEQVPLHRDFEKDKIAVSVGEITSQLAQLAMQLTLRQRINVTQLNDLFLVEKHRLAKARQDEEFSISSDDGLMLKRQLCVPTDSAVVDRLTKSSHFILEKSTYIVSKWGQLHMTEIVKLHGVPVSIVSDRDDRFTPKFCKGLQIALGTRLYFNTAFHPQTDGQT
ncbi:pol protein [Cucumis melo var. makuwa]|uniref:Pol protein n=1 Tax=Cucumis melo var. makuwa TaxID=1194695 RepID=A0A5D3DQK7_CUCMM|nr:pol protein [Cucumis melo var. makuwa]